MIIKSDVKSKGTTLFYIYIPNSKACFAVIFNIRTQSLKGIIIAVFVITATATIKKVLAITFPAQETILVSSAVHFGIEVSTVDFQWVYPVTIKLGTLLVKLRLDIYR